MQTRRLVGLIGIFAIGGGLVAQQPPPQKKTEGEKKIEGARDLFYFGATQKDPLPPIQKAMPPRAPKSTPVVTQSAGTQPRVPAPPVAAVEAVSLLPHLGLRYTLVLVNETSGKAESVDPDRNFRKGDCLRFEVESNQSGYLYVLNKHSSGGWKPLFPAPEIANESNVIDPGKKVSVPKEYCFEIDDPPGTESLFVMLSRSPRDFFELYDAIKNPAPVAPAAPANTPRTTSDPVQMADARVNSAVEKMAKTFGTRDLVIKKVTPVTDKQETDFSVYVVSASDKPSSTVVKKVEIRHR